MRSETGFPGDGEVRRTRGLWAVVWPALGAVAATACGTAGSLRPPPLPPPAQVQPVQARRAGAVRVARVAAAPGIFAAAFVVRGGPLDDPIPGLGGLLADAALLETARDPSREEPPVVRALALGAELRAVANGRVVGWWIQGPAREAQALTRLLLDVGLEATLPATRVAGLVSQRRTEAREAGPDAAAVMTAAALAAGVATGLGRPLRLDVTDGGLRGWNREVLARFARRLVRPERAALVLSGPGSGEAARAVDRAVKEATARLASWHPPEPEPSARAAPTRPRACAAPRRSAQLVIRAAAEDRGEHLLAFVAYPAPGPGDARRAAFEVAMNALGADVTGALTAALGPARAARRPVALLDLGGPGAGRAVLLVRVGGRARAVLGDLWKTLEAGEEVATPSHSEAAARRWAAAQRQAAAERQRVATDPATGVLEVAASLLYGARGGLDVEEGARALLARGGATVVGVGPPALGEVLKHLGPLTVWSAEGHRRGGAAPPRCP